MSDIVNRLKTERPWAYDDNGQDFEYVEPKLADEAIVEIERLQQYPSVIAEMKQGSFTDARVCEDIERRVKERNAVAVHKAAATPDEGDR